MSNVKSLTEMYVNSQNKKYIHNDEDEDIWLKVQNK